MRTALWVMALVLCQTLQAAHAAATGEGLTPAAAEKAWPRWQTRFSGNDDARFISRSVLFGDSGLKSRSVGVLGDYYFSRSTWISHTVGGFRATGAMFFGPRSDDSPGLWQSSRYTLASTSGRPAGLVAAPYAGVGYTAMSATRAWGVSADLGLMSMRPSSGGIGRSAGSSLALDDAGRETRVVSPLLQVGVSYSF